MGLFQSDELESVGPLGIRECFHFWSVIFLLNKIFAELIIFSAVWINSMVATCRVGCWCCIDDNIIEPLTVVDEEMLPEGQIVSEEVIIDPNAQAQGWFTAYLCYLCLTKL